MSIKKYLKLMVEKNGSDLFYRAGTGVRMRIDGSVVTVDKEILSLNGVQKAVEELTNDKQKEYFSNNHDVDFAYYLEELKRRFRVSIFMQRNSPRLLSGI